MKINFRLFVFIASLLLILSSPRLEAAVELFPSGADDVKISLDLQDADLKDILKILSIQSGMNFIASEGVQDRKLTLFLDQVPLEEALNRIFQANNLSYDLHSEARIIIVKDWGKPELETVTKIFHLKYATVTSSPLTKASSESGAGGAEGGITPIIRKIISSGGVIVEDPRTNSLLISDIPSRMPLIEKTIALLDVPAPQVMIEVEMLDVNKKLTDTIGFKFGQSPFTVILTGASAASGFPFGSWFKLFNQTENHGTLGINGASSYQVVMDFLKADTDTKTLARPRLMTLNNQPAEIKITTDEAIGLETSTTGSSSETTTQTQEAERAETGVSLKVTPQANLETGEITMHLYPCVKEATAGGTFGGQSFKDPEERSTKSMVRIKDGETVIIGGLIRNDYSEVITKLPVLGDLPLVGRFFRHKNKSKDNERELLVFITPHIIREANLELAKAKEASAIPEREQGSASGVNRQVAISSSLDNYEKRR